MDITLSVAAFIFSIIGTAGCISPVLPGTVMSYAGLLCAYFTSYSHISTPAVWIWLAISIAVCAADYFLPAWMTRRFGGSKAGAIGATVGVIAGFFLFPPFGVILGPFMGRPRPCSSASARSSRSSSGRGSSSSPRSACSFMSPPTPTPSCGTGLQRFSNSIPIAYEHETVSDSGGRRAVDARHGL